MYDFQLQCCIDDTMVNPAILYKNISRGIRFATNPVLRRNFVGLNSVF